MIGRYHSQFFLAFVRADGLRLCEIMFTDRRRLFRYDSLRHVDMQLKIEVFRSSTTEKWSFVRASNASQITGMINRPSIADDDSLYDHSGGLPVNRKSLPALIQRLQGYGLSGSVERERKRRRRRLDLCEQNCIVAFDEGHLHRALSDFRPLVLVKKIVTKSGCRKLSRKNERPIGKGFPGGIIRYRLNPHLHGQLQLHAVAALPNTFDAEVATRGGDSFNGLAIDGDSDIVGGPGRNPLIEEPWF